MTNNNSSIFGIQYTGNDVALHSKMFRTKDEMVTVKKIEFYKRLFDVFDGIIGDDFDWSNVLFAGGLLAGVVDTNYKPETYKSSDIDLFIYGSSEKEIVSVAKRTYQYLLSKTNGNCYALCYGFRSIIHVLIPGKRLVQIICTANLNPLSVLEGFDFTHCQIGYDGSDVVYTSDFLNAQKTKITCIKKKYVGAHRLVKAHLRGFDIMKGDFSAVNQDSSSYNDLTPEQASSSRKIWSIQSLQKEIDNIINDPIVKHNLSKCYIPTSSENSDEVIKRLLELFKGAQILNTPDKKVNVGVSDFQLGVVPLYSYDDKGHVIFDPSKHFKSQNKAFVYK